MSQGFSGKILSQRSYLFDGGVVCSVVYIMFEV